MHVRKGVRQSGLHDGSQAFPSSITYALTPRSCVGPGASMIGEVMERIERDEDFRRAEVANMRYAGQGWRS